MFWGLATEFAGCQFAIVASGSVIVWADERNCGMNKVIFDFEAGFDFARHEKRNAFTLTLTERFYGIFSPRDYNLLETRWYFTSLHLVKITFKQSN